MKNTYPSYYKQFSCIADRCPDTCCAGWTVVADAESLEKYRNTAGSFGDKIRSVISVDDDGDTVFIPVNNRCPFLLENGLCEMYIELGHENLCRTCRQFPRHITYFGARSESGISLSCPEAARLITKKSDPITFETENNLDFPQPTDIDAELYFTLLEARKKAIDILQNREFSIEDRLCAFLLFVQKISPFARHLEYNEILSAITENYFIKEKPTFSQRKESGSLKRIFSDFRELEMLDISWKDALSEAENTDVCRYADSVRKHQWEYEHLAVYFVFRYFMTAVFDGGLLTKAKLAAVSFIVIQRLQASVNADKETRTKIIQKYCKEVEHSASNMDFLNKSIKKSRCYGTENLINIIMEKQL